MNGENSLIKVAYREMGIVSFGSLLQFKESSSKSHPEKIWTYEPLDEFAKALI